MEEATRKGKGMATNRNELGVELKLKNSKIQLGDVKVVVCANKMACSEFFLKTSCILTCESCLAWVKGMLDRKA
jgi:hypothetical protein